MLEISTPSRRTVLISISAVIGVTTISSLAYLFYRDNYSKSTTNRKFRALQRNFYARLLQIEDNLDDLIETDLRLIQIRTKTLRTHRIHTADEDVKLPSLGLINHQDKAQLGTDIEETKEELIRERTQGFEDSARVRQGYRQLDLLVKALHKQLLKLLERADAIDLSELAEVGDETGGISNQNESEILVFEKLRKRRRSTLAKVQRVIAQLDRIQASYKTRLHEIKDIEKLERIGLEPSDQVQPAVESEMMKEGVTFADVAALNIEEPEILAPTEDLEKMKQGISFADAVAENLPEEETEKRKVQPKEKPKEKPKAQPNVETSAPKPAKKVTVVEEPEDKGTAVLAPTDDLGLMKEGVTFADITKENIEEPEVLAPTEDLEKMKEGITFADITKENIEEPEVLAPTEDLELMNEGVTFADIAKENIKEPEVLAPTEDLKKIKQGLTFADVVADE
ncbi:hypothetical protein EC957_004222 [Mortierella hygrophila]|uniref:Uncharacterized protein n=1 Tax=Mortierella hygrophila TaxID=979708 RepID=A0A9P6FFZ6_9FUNG|nr:hypothetical protein EC957_004222 [Mortierella hygrophila]